MVCSSRRSFSNDSHPEVPRTIQEIFDQQDELAEKFEHFDPEVRRTLKLRDDATRSHLNRYGEWLWFLTKIELGTAMSF